MRNRYIIAFCLLMILGRFQPANGQVDTEFWFVVPELSYRFGTGGKPGKLQISTHELEATVTVSMPANAWDPVGNPQGFEEIVIHIPGNSAEAVDLSHLIDEFDHPDREFLENKNLTPDGINNFGLHITATNLINVYWAVDYTAPVGPGGADIWTLKGENALGTLFFTPFQTVYNNRLVSPVAYSAIDVVATQDGTSVTFTLPPGKAASYGLPMTAIAPGGTHTVILNEGQTFSLFPLNKSTAAGDRLAGTKIESNLPIAVTLKDDAVAVGPSGADVVGDQLIPVDITGDTYIVPEINNPNHVYVLATEDNTPIYVFDPAGNQVGASPYAILNAGQQALVTVPNGINFVRITSAPGAYKPFYVFQMGIENNARGGALVPPIGCTGNTQLAFTRAFDDNKFYFFIIVEEGNQDKFLIDGARRDGIINPGAFVPIAGSGGYMAFFSNSINSNTLSQGQHLVTNTGGVFHLGILNGFPGGGQGQKLNYGYYSDFGNLNVGASVAGTNSQVTRACHADPVQLYAFGGTVYNWTPDTYLDDATSNMPIAYNLPPGAHAYTAEVSGACGSGTVDITILVADPVRAFFRTDVATGCSPLEVTFTDLSEGAWSWRYDMGNDSLFRHDLDPSTTAILPPPDPFVFSRTYHNTTDEPIEYTVTLLVRNESGCADFFTKTIVVYPEIEAGFTADPIQGCDPVEVAFTNTSTGNTDKWFWEFGDGGSSIEENPVHTYSNLFGPTSEVFDARLVATSPFLCRDTAWQTITVEPYIEALFTFEEPVGCHPHEIEIYNQSFGADRYFWDFGDGTTSETTQLLFNKTFPNTGTEPETYIITLFVENDEGCFDEMVREVTVYPDISAAFTALPGEGCSPLEVEFFNDSRGAAFYQWEFGDGGSSPEENPVHVYERNLTGSSITYDVSLVAVSEEMCSDTAWTRVTVHPWIEAAFTVENVAGCDPFDIIINNLSSGADYYYWDFGDGTTSTTSDPVIEHTYRNTSGGTVVYPLTLTVENEEGCTHTLIREITVHTELTADFLVDRLEGCSPLEVAFTNLSAGAATYYWDFGDGASSIEPDPVHTFTNNGTTDTVYLVTLITTSGDGLCVKSVSWPIRVHGVSEAAFSVSGGIDCTPSEIIFENLSTGGMNHIWDFGDGTVINTAEPEPVTHIFSNYNNFSDIREFQVSLLVEHYAGCNSQSTKTVRVYPDIRAGFGASSVGDCHPLTVDFTNLSQGAGSWHWDFGDGTSSSLQHPQHTFTNTGTVDSVYTVTLVATAPNNVCMASFSMDITVHPYIKAAFTVPDALDCSPFDVVIENSSVNGSVFYWDFGNGTDTVTHNTDPFVRRFTNPGFTNRQEFEISLTAENFAGCRSATRRTITVEPDIAADFEASSVQGCHPLVVDFTNFSQGAAYYSWDFDNGTGSSSVHPSAFFTNFGVTDKTYRVKLVATAGNHVCKDSLYVDITVHPFIRADFTFGENIACSPSAVTFHNASTGGELFYWDFGDGTTTVTSGMEPVLHNFDNSSFNSVAEFPVTLVAENHAGCPSEITRIVQVYPAIEAAFEVSADEGCHPLTVDFANRSNGGHTYLWEFGDGSTSSSISPSYTFTNFTDAPVTRRVRLTARSRDNCVSDTLMDITIYPNPVARFEIDRTIACPPFDLEITNTSINASGFRWEFGDGNSLTTGSSAPVNHIYENAGDGIADFDLKLVASTQFGCLDSTWQTVSVYPAAIAGFSSIEEGCSPLTVEFTNQSVRGHTWQWDLGDGITMGVTNPSHTYNNHSVNDSVFTVTLTATTVHGCTDRVSGPVTVYPQPRADFTASPTHQVYPSTTVTLLNESNPGYWEYLWETGDGSSFNSGEPEPYAYEDWGDYEIRLTAWSAHCTATTTRNIRILPPPPVASFDPAIPGCAPLEVRFRNRSEYGTAWLWEFDDGNVSEQFEPVHIFTEDGMYNVRLTASGPGGTHYSYRMVEVYRNPVAMFKVAPELVMLPDEEVRLFNMSEHGVSWLWDFGDGATSVEKNPGHLYAELGVYTISLDVWTEHNCTDRYVLPEAVTVAGQGAIRFPNAFRPDNGGPNGGYYDIAETRNHIFRPAWEGVIEYKLRIYNRWGELLYVSDDVMKGWDGYYQGSMAKQDVYVWKVWGKFTNGKNFVEAGDVTLLR